MFTIGDLFVQISFLLRIYLTLGFNEAPSVIEAVSPGLFTDLSKFLFPRRFRSAQISLEKRAQRIVTATKERKVLATGISSVETTVPSRSSFLWEEM